MLLPVAQAQPAELEFALFAIHVVAALVLLDRSATSRAWFGVGAQPIRVAGVARVLFYPLLHQIARTGGVRLGEKTKETKSREETRTHTQ